MKIFAFVLPLVFILGCGDIEKDNASAPAPAPIASLCPSPEPIPSCPSPEPIPSCPPNKICISKKCLIWVKLKGCVLEEMGIE